MGSRVATMYISPMRTTMFTPWPTASHGPWSSWSWPHALLRFRVGGLSKENLDTRESSLEVGDDWRWRPYHLTKLDYDTLTLEVQCRMYDKDDKELPYGRIDVSPWLFILRPER